MQKALLHCKFYRKNHMDNKSRCLNTFHLHKLYMQKPLPHYRFCKKSHIKSKIRHSNISHPHKKSNLRGLFRCKFCKTHHNKNHLKGPMGIGRKCRLSVLLRYKLNRKSRM